MVKTAFLYFIVLATIACSCALNIMSYTNAKISNKESTIIDTKLVQTVSGDYVLATFSSPQNEISYKLYLNFLSRNNDDPILIHNDTDKFVWDIRPSYDKTSSSAVEVFYSADSSNSTWYLVKYTSDGVAHSIHTETSASFIPNAFLAYKPSADDYGCYIIANSKRELYVSNSTNFTKIGDFVSIDFASFAVGQQSDQPALFFVGVGLSDIRSAIWYVDPSSSTGFIPQRLDASEGILQIDLIAYYGTDSIIVQQSLNGYTKIYRWQMSNPTGTLTSFQVQGTFFMYPFMISPTGRFLVYADNPLPAFGKIKLSQWVNWNGENPNDSENYVLQDNTAISGLSSMISPASSYLQTESLSIVIAYPSGFKVKVTELKFQGDQKKPASIAVSGFQVPQNVKNNNRRLSEVSTDLIKIKEFSHNINWLLLGGVGVSAGLILCFLLFGLSVKRGFKTKEAFSSFHSKVTTPRTQMLSTI